MNELDFTIASTPDEFMQIERLNHDTFAGEIPQHTPNRDGRLRDKFHDQNTYVICKDGGVVVGMLALRGKRPFSLDGKLPGLDSLLPPHEAPCELRLLSVRPHRRRGRVAAGMLALAAKTLLRWGHDLVLVSATTRELDFYHGMGFVDFGPLVGKEGALYQPMHLTYGAFDTVLRPRLERLFPDTFDQPVNFLPGPPTLSARVRRAAAAPAIHHRSREVRQIVRTTAAVLAHMTNAKDVVVTPGSGTSANDMLASTLTSSSGCGLVASNGEFGVRLVDHAERAGLRFEHMAFAWGKPIDLDALRERVKRVPDIRWLWVVHGETSTGVLNPLRALEALCAEADLELYVDAVSTIGTRPVDLSGCAMATGVSGKGLGAIPGLALLFLNRPFTQRETRSGPRSVLRSLDAQRVTDEGGIPGTMSSMLVTALRAAVDECDPAARAAAARGANAWLRDRLPDLGLSVVSDASASFDSVLTLQVPPPLDSVQIGETMERRGFWLAHQSRYLRERNWLQVCFMTSGSAAEVESLLDSLGDVVLPEIDTTGGAIAAVAG